MSLLYPLLCVELLYLIFCWKRFRHELFSPATITVCVFIFSTILNIYSIQLWRIDFQIETFLLISIGLLFIIFGDERGLLSKRQKLLSSPKEILYRCPRLIQLFIACITCVLTFLYYREMLAFIVANALANIGEAKEVAILGDNIEMNPIIKQGYKIVVAESYICGFIFINNRIIFKDKLKNNILLLIPIFCGILISICGGNRIEILKIISSLFFIYYILYQRKYGWKKKPNKQLMILCVPCGILFLFAFSALRFVTKADMGAQENMGDIYQYIAYYGGSPIQVLNLKIEQGIENWRTNYWGGLTFSGIYEFLHSIGITGMVKTKLSSMIYVGGDSNASGNVYTIFGRTYSDFGFFGTCVFVFLLYYYFSKYYHHKIKYSYHNIKLIIYAFCFSNVIFFAFYDTCLYTILCQTGILQILVIYILCKLQLKYKQIV